VLLIVALAGMAQQVPPPDAPSSSRQPTFTQNGPRSTAAPKQPAASSSSSSAAQQTQLPDAPQPQLPPPPGNNTPGSAGTSSSQPPPAPTSENPGTDVGPPSRPSAAPPPGAGDFTISTNVNFVLVPVTVKDSGGHLVAGLVKRDFSVFEDGAPVTLQLFTSDPFPLSVAVLLDTGMSDLTLNKVQETLPALSGAFSQYDEISFYTFGSSVERLSDFSSAQKRIDEAIRRLRYRDDGSRRTGRQGGFAVAGGPLNSSPTINGKPVDPNAPIVEIAREEPRVLNDAILAAANDLSARERTRRRMIFVISEGRERGSNASYSDVLKVLLSHEISVYAVNVGQSAAPVYGSLQKVRVPGMGYANLLPKYASATGGDVIAELNRQAIEAAYQRATLEARNQYTLGYTARATAASNYRQIEVVVRRPNLKVFARDGYYPLPPQRK